MRFLTNSRVLHVSLISYNILTPLMCNLQMWFYVYFDQRIFSQVNGLNITISRIKYQNLVSELLRSHMLSVKVVLFHTMQWEVSVLCLH